MFADLVGFTALAEDRDAEEVRELLSRYFDTARRVIGRYGGTVEKFIGDAVMAVWGAPIAREDDAERAVRAALELVDAVRALGEDAGTPALRARAGVTAGEAAVTVGAEGQGMVAGDLVNTASRVQTAAQPGSVYVGEATRRMSEAAVVYEDAGEHELKGKAEPVRLWRALRVVAATGGAQRSSALEPPFAGRNRELRMVKELFHASADDHRAQLVSVVGGAGIGKSRLVWEFFKYLDGLAIDTRWHRGRCLAYGEGVTYWALAEMVRTNASILEGEDPDTALPKLLEAVEIVLPDPEERRWVEPRLASLLGLETGPARDREDVFAAWRLFYERLAEVDADRHGLRRHPLGRHVAARLRRVPARVVAQLTPVHPHPGAPGAARAQTGLGIRPTRLDLHLPRAAHRRLDDHAPRGTRPPGHARRPGARPSRGSTALRRRDSANARRSGRAHPRRCRLPGNGADG